MIGIRREDRNRWERRAPLTPDHIGELIARHGIRCRVQPSETRAFRDSDYREAGAEICESLDGCRVVLGVKEIPPDKIRPGVAHLCFAHVVKGQPANMPALRRFLDLGCSLIDYERIADERGRRLIFFGKHAGHAGMIDTLSALGRRLAADGHETPLAAVRPAHAYADLGEAHEHLTRIGERIRRNGVPPALHPIVIGFAGSGNVIQGAHETFSYLPYEEVAPDELPGLADDADLPRNALFKVDLATAERVVRIDGGPIDRYEVRRDPSLYRSVMARHLPYLTTLVNGVYWEPGQPRVASAADLRALWSGPRTPRLRVVGDISCDLGGSVEATVRLTTPDDPVYVWDPETGATTPGVVGRGPVILAVDNLPCELPVEASEHFGDALVRFVPALARCDWTRSHDALGLPPSVRRALVVHRGTLTPEYTYLERDLASSPES